MVDRYVEVARKAAEKVTGKAYCQYSMHEVPVERLVPWKNGKRICLSCAARRKK